MVRKEYYNMVRQPCIYRGVVTDIVVHIKDKANNYKIVDLVKNYLSSAIKIFIALTDYALIR